MLKYLDTNTSISMGDFVVCYAVEFEFRCGVQKMVMKSCPDLMLLMLKSLEAFCFLNSHRFLGAEIGRRLEVLVIGKFCFRGLTQTESNCFFSSAGFCGLVALWITEKHGLPCNGRKDLCISPANYFIFGRLPGAHCCVK